MVLYVYTIQRRVDSDAVWRKYFQAAEKCHRQISLLASEKDSFAQRYSIVLEELRAEAVKQSERPIRVKSTKSGLELESDPDAEVARKILRLSDNNHMDSYSIPRGDQHRHNSINSTQSQTPMPTDYSTLKGFHQAEPSEQDSMHFTRNNTASNPATFTGEATGWGDFDSFVSIMNL